MQPSRDGEPTRPFRRDPRRVHAAHSASRLGKKGQEHGLAVFEPGGRKLLAPLEERHGGGGVAFGDQDRGEVESRSRLGQVAVDPLGDVVGLLGRAKRALAFTQEPARLGLDPHQPAQHLLGIALASQVDPAPRVLERHLGSTRIRVGPGPESHSHRQRVVADQGRGALHHLAGSPVRGLDHRRELGGLGDGLRREEHAQLEREGECLVSRLFGKTQAFESEISGAPHITHRECVGHAGGVVEGGQGVRIVIAARPGLALLEQGVGFVPRDARAPAVLEDHQPGLLPQLECEGRILDLHRQVSHPVPVTPGLRRVAAGDPLRRAPMPVGRGGHLSGLVPVVGEECGILVEAIRVECLDRRGDPCVIPGPLIGQLAPLGDLMGEGMPEGVLEIGIERLLVDQLGAPQCSERLVELALPQLADLAQERLGEFASDRCRRLQHALLSRRESVDASRQNRLNRGGDGQAIQGRGETAVASLAHEASGLGQSLNELFDEERIPRRALANETAQGIERRIGAQQVIQEIRDGLLSEGPQRELLVARVGHPVGAVLGAEVQQQEGARPGNDLCDARQELLAPRVDPVDVVEQQNRGLPRASRVDQTPHEGEQRALPRRRIHRLEGAIRSRHAEKVEGQR